MSKVGQVGQKISANAKALGGSAKVVAFLVIVLVVLYSDVMFVALLWNAFPGGFMRILAIGGAFATGITVIFLYVGKSHWFRPGPQLVTAWVFTGIELVISIMNVIVAVIVARGDDLGYLSYWLFIAPATPFLAVLGWILIGYMDAGRAELHDRMEMEDDQRRAELDHEKALHSAKMDLQSQSLDYVTAFLQQEIRNVVVQDTLRQHAHDLAVKAAESVTGEKVMLSSQQPPVLPQPQNSSSDNYVNRIGHPMQPRLDRTNRQVIFPDGSRMSFEEFYGLALAEQIEPSSPLAQPSLDTQQANQAGSQNGKK